MSDSDAPPAYDGPSTATNTTTPSSPHIITLVRCKPGIINDRDMVCCGKIIERTFDAISIPNGITRSDMLDVLTRRVQVRFHFRGEESCSHGVIVLQESEHEGEGVELADEESWRAGRDILARCGNAKLTFLFAEVPEGYKGPEAPKAKKCVMM